VPAARMYYEPAKPLQPAQTGEPRPPAGRSQLLELTDVLGKRQVTTALNGRVTVREENAAAALEVMSRFAVDSPLADLSAAHDVAA